MGNYIESPVLDFYSQMKSSNACAAYGSQIQVNAHDNGHVHVHCIVCMYAHWHILYAETHKLWSSRFKWGIGSHGNQIWSCWSHSTWKWEHTDTQSTSSRALTHAQTCSEVSMHAMLADTFPRFMARRERQKKIRNVDSEKGRRRAKWKKRWGV